MAKVDEQGIPARPGEIHSRQRTFAFDFRLPCRAGRGFTLLEILLVLALVGLIGALLAAGITRVFSDDHPAPEDVFWQACRSAQKLASLSEREVSLGFDAKEKKLVWSNGLETDEASFDPAGGEVSVQFLQAPRAAA